ncbi:MAG: inositol monophosphatase [Campylobacteraceae bacterium]|nr:inositol monophosphatase [Campylobacteraceae bacterium]
MNENLNEILKNLDEFLDTVAAYQLEARKSGFKIETKSSSVDFVTEVDKKSDEMIINFIKTNYPTHQILTEEHGVVGDESPWCWVVDPIDGTTNFIHSYPLHSISVGLKFNGERVLGLVVLPVLKMKFSAIKGQGAFLNGEKISVSKTTELKNAIVSTGFPYSRAVENPNLEYFNKIINHIAGIRRSGSAAIDLCFTAAGYSDAYFEFNINEWDFCAGWLILEEAGGHGKSRKFGHNTMYIFTNSYIDNALNERLFG